MICEWDLTGAEMVPPITTTAEGTAQFWMSNLGVLRIVITHDVYQADFGALYIGRADEIGPLAIGLGPDVSGTIEHTFSEDELELIDSVAELAINIRVASTAHPDGEIRGQYACYEPELTDENEYLLVKVTGDGNSDPIPDVHAYDYGTPVVLAPHTVVGSGYAFDHWAGDITSTDYFQMLTMTRHYGVEAVFVSPGDWTLTMGVTGNGSGYVWPEPGIHSWLDGRIAYFAAVPDEGSYFGGWTGDLSNRHQPYPSLLMDDDKAANAIFTDSGYTLTVNLEGTGGLLPQAGTYELANSYVTTVLVFDTDSAWRFDHWEGDLGSNSATANYINLGMNQDRDVTAVFEDGDVMLTIAVSEDGTTDPGAGEYSYWADEEEVVSIEAVPDSGKVFMWWEGDLGYEDAYSRIISLEMTENREVTPVFGDADYTLTITKSGDGFVEPGIGTFGYADGSVAYLMANRVETGDYYFDHWEGDIGELDPHARTIVIEMDDDKEIEAVFTESTRELSIEVDPEESGEVVFDPDLSEFPPGTIVTLWALPVEGYNFVKWSGDIDSFTNPLVYRADDDYEITAEFMERGPHAADIDQDWVISDSELERVEELFEAEAYSCSSESDDGYTPGAGDEECIPHSADYDPQDWVIDQDELNRVMELHDAMGGYRVSFESGDGYMPVNAEILVDAGLTTTTNRCGIFKSSVFLTSYGGYTGHAKEYSYDYCTPDIAVDSTNPWLVRTAKGRPVRYMVLDSSDFDEGEKIMYDHQTEVHEGGEMSPASRLMRSTLAFNCISFALGRTDVWINASLPFLVDGDFNNDVARKSANRAMHWPTGDIEPKHASWVLQQGSAPATYQSFIGKYDSSGVYWTSASQPASVYETTYTTYYYRKLFSF